MKDHCENCHTDRAYIPKIRMPDDHPRLCYNCFIKAQGLEWYIMLMLENGIAWQKAMAEIYDAVDTLHSPAQGSLDRIINTMGEYWQKVGERAASEQERPRNITPIRKGTGQ